MKKYLTFIGSITLFFLPFITQINAQKMKSEKKIIINTDAKHLWSVLTKSEFTKEYMFNCSVESNWEIGSPITWQGNYQGYEAFQKGKIIAYEPYRLIKYSTFDPNFGLEDKPANYIHVSYLLNEIDGQTELRIINETFDGNEERMTHINQGWEMVIHKIKESAEKVKEKPFLGLRTTIYKVANLDKAKEWYAKAFATPPYFEETFYVGFNILGYELGLLPEESPTTEKPESVLTYWGVNDIEKEYNRLLELGAKENEKPTNVGGELMVASVKDPWGNVIGLIYNPAFKLEE